MEKHTLFEKWTAPEKKNKFLTGLCINNSLCAKVVEFIPHQPSKEIRWYGCGPTVYDAAHMGHARTYVAFDIIRRILSDYFGYNIYMCMNITDIDDKIIKRSNEMQVNFANLARYWEGMFWKDMQALNVLLPDIITRVSEFIPEIIKFIEKIIDNGFAYESEGSIYFDIRAFSSKPPHAYGRMEPNSTNNESRVLEGEGDLSITTSKRFPLDFALWKKVKADEPSWESPWGLGRPGWHIECSTMASSVLGFPIDIHSGGIDLRFPHHDNELAQSEANYNKPQWINYFLHSGHLHIKGSKMSKSLKNFITIDECLKKFSGRAIRILTLMHRWDTPMNYSADGETMVEATEIDHVFINFFASIKTYLRKATTLDQDMPKLLESNFELSNLTGQLGHQNWTKADFLLHDTLLSLQKQIDDALKNNFDTPTALAALRSMINNVNSYMNEEKNVIKNPLIFKISRYIFSLLKIFGLTNGSASELNYAGEISESQHEDFLTDCITDFRHNVRKTSQHLLKLIGENNTSSALDQIKSLLTSCDHLRDKILPEIGIQIEDTNKDSTWKKLPKDFMKENECKSKNKKSKEESNAMQIPSATETLEKNTNIASIPPHLYFPLLKSNIYSEFDDEGLPQARHDGEIISKTAKTKMKKFLQKQSVVYDQYSKGDCPN